MAEDQDDAAEQRARRLELEQELTALEDTWGKQSPVVRYIERRVYKPMPPQVVKVKGPTQYVDRMIEKPVDRVVEKIIERWTTRPAGFFGRIGDFIDRLVGSPPGSDTEAN